MMVSGFCLCLVVSFAGDEVGVRERRIQVLFWGGSIRILQKGPLPNVAF